MEGRHGGGTAAAAVWPHTLPCSRRAAASVTRPRCRAPGRANGGCGTANPSVRSRSRPGPPRSCSFLLPSTTSGYDVGAASASTAVVVGDMEIKRCTRYQYQSRTHSQYRASRQMRPLWRCTHSIRAVCRRKQRPQTAIYSTWAHSITDVHTRTHNPTDGTRTALAD